MASDDFKYLYRLLRVDEHPDEYGIFPTNPFARVSVQRQILYGTFIKSQFISTASSLEGLLKFALRAKTRPLRIAVIDLDTLMADENVKIYNLSDKVVQNKYLRAKRAIRRVGITKQVLINGTIPATSILCVAEKHCRYENLYTTEQPGSKNLVAKDPTSNVTIEEFVLNIADIASQFVCTYVSRDTTERNTPSSEKTARINTRALEESGTAIFIDLTQDGNIERYLQSETSKLKAKEDKIVLIIGSVPTECIKILE